MYRKIKTSRKVAGESGQSKAVSDREFHAALQLLIQFLYIIRDMASSQDDKNQKNAKIL